MKYCEKEGCEASTLFALKASLKDVPYPSLLTAFCLSSLVLGIPVKNFELPLNEYLSSGIQQYTIWNGVWLIIITMTTVGFGDFFCRSHVGRICSILSIFWGIFLTSLMVVTLTASMSLDAKESRAFNILYRLKARKNLEDKATFIATLIIRARALYKDNERRKEGLDPTKPADKEKLKELAQKYDNEKAEIYSKLDIFKSMFNEAFSNLKSADEDPVEEIRKLSLSIEHDFNEMRNFFIAIKEIEANLLSVQKSHEVIDKVIEQCKAYNQLFNKEILQYKGGIFDIEKKKPGADGEPAPEPAADKK
jgi:potassium intermediate/small conductance calcium-activated channel subfamily N protein 2